MVEIEDASSGTVEAGRLADCAEGCIAPSDSNGAMLEETDGRDTLIDDGVIAFAIDGFELIAPH